MNAEAGKPRSQKRSSWRLRLIAITAALLLAAAIYFMQTMPAAGRLADGDDLVTAAGTRTLALYNLPAAPLLQYSGSAGAGLKVSVSAARLTPATRKSLSALGAQLPNVRGAPMQWHGRPPADGRVELKIVNQRQFPEAGIMLQAAGDGAAPGIKVLAAQTMLTVQIEMTGAASAAPVAGLNFAGAAVDNPKLASTPLQFEIPTGETMDVTFDNGAALASSSFRLGEPAKAGRAALQVGRAEVGPLAGSRSYPRLSSVERGVCASGPGRFLFDHAYPRPNDCEVGDDLYAKAIAIDPGKIELSLEGSGFVLEDDRARPSSFWSAVRNNPVNAAVIAVLVLALAGPMWMMGTGRGK